MINTKNELKETVRVSLRLSIEQVLRRASLKSILQLTILDEADISKMDPDYSCKLRNYNEYLFYLESSKKSGKTEIYVYQSDMSKQHSGLYMEISADKLFADLDDYSFNYYCDCLVSFLLANSVWE